MNRGDVYLAPFPYSDHRGRKRRPVCIVSSAAYNRGPDVIVAMVTSSAVRQAAPGIGDVALGRWQEAGLLRPSIVRTGRLIFIEVRMLGGRLGSLEPADLRAIEVGLKTVLDLE